MLAPSPNKDVNPARSEKLTKQLNSASFGNRDSAPKGRLDWARIWHSKLAKFHGVANPNGWRFTREQVIEYLRYRKKQGMPAKKRVLVVRGLIVYRNYFLKSESPQLEDMSAKLAGLAVRESNGTQATGDSAGDTSVGKVDPREPDVVQQLRRSLRANGKAYNTEKAYVKWVRRFMRVRGLKSLNDFHSVDSKNVEAFLTDLAVDGNCAASTQDQAFFAFKFLFEYVLQRALNDVNAMRCDKPTLLPTVLDEEEVASIFHQLSGVYLVVAQLLYGCGLRIGECLRLRIKDFDFSERTIRVFNSKGNSSRRVPLPEKLVETLSQLIERRRLLHEDDVRSGKASVWLPFALARKYPNAEKEFAWQYLFASVSFSRNKRTGKFHRHHIHWDTFTSRLRRAVRVIGMTKHVTCHTFRHSFATSMLNTGTDIRTIQELLGHKDVSTTMVYTHVMNQRPVQSPLDHMLAPGSVGGGIEVYDALETESAPQKVQPVVESRDAPVRTKKWVEFVRQLGGRMLNSRYLHPIRR